ncbi:glycosyl transferase [Psychromonas marina]|uniref:Glycosyl transferase n=1 Tax=Psychromonas marina TaxID=88364 RepID=A0ABQ6E1M1_9GAMM|nr:glycosyltransferase family 2 protein [Psychromonas marina]GLS91289.1 glycosyl transferase [Psychromonas marina]
MNNLILISITVMSGLLVIYHHLGYPLLLRYLTKDKMRTKNQQANRFYVNSTADDLLPTIAIIMPAYNEAQWIAEKIRNLSVLDYPTNRLQIIIGCDGCSDDTYHLACATAKEPECEHLDIKVLDFKVNQGKVAVVNALVADVDCELVALSDTSALLSIDSLLIAAQRFNDPTIGVLNGHYRLIKPGSAGEQAYWDYQSQIKLSEAVLGSTLGAHGAFYMFRRALFEPLAADTINDDFILPMKIVEAGYRAEYEDTINALELESANNNQDHQRRRRIAAGNFQQLLRLKKLLLPRYKGIAFSFISGKALRVLMPFMMITSLLGSLWLAADYWLFMLLAIIQLSAYCIATYQLIRKPKNSHKVSKLLAYLVSGHIAGLIGTLRYLFRLDKGHWTKTSSPEQYSNNK